MNRIVIIMLFLLPLNGNTQNQDLPDFVQKKLDVAKEKTRKYLMNYRISKNLPWPSDALDVLFSYREQQIIDSLGLKLHVSMVYDDDMRERMVELLENRYRQYELDTLVKRRMSDEYNICKRRAIDQCHFDTISIFKQKYDSLNHHDYLYDNTIYTQRNKFTVLSLLHLDTTMMYKNALIEILEERKKEIEQSIQNNPYYDLRFIAELCGYVSDKRFIAPLEKILEREKDNERVLEALARMKAEPHYTNYLTERTRSIEDIKKRSPRFSLNDFVYVLGNQEAYLELSKYLLSDATGSVDVIDMPDTTMYSESPIYLEAIYFIKVYIENSSLQKTINSPNFDEKKESDRLKVYNWMQKNYGKYQIRRIWW
jgi:hypothetical protein